MRLLICAGGTGGGVYPALAVLHALQAESAGVDLDVRNTSGVVEPDGDRNALAGLSSSTRLPHSVLWTGSRGGMEVDLLKQTGIPFEAISSGQIAGVGLRALASAVQIVRGYWQSRRILQRFKPDVLLFTGGYVAVPMALAGRKIPTLLYVPDIEPGLALKTLARFADCIAVTVRESQAYFSPQARLEVTGYPVRQDLLAWDIVQARKALGLSDGLQTLLVFGGSKGARSINQAILSALPALLAQMQVVHISGRLDWTVVEDAQKNLANQLPDPAWASRYRAFPYLHDEMGAALSVADLVVSRAGASSLGEFPQFGLPAILVPYPYAWRYQKVNASYLEQRHAAVMLRDEDLSVRLSDVVLDLMADQPRREQMRQAMRSLARPNAAQSIVRALQDLAKQPRRERNS